MALSSFHRHKQVRIQQVVHQMQSLLENSGFPFPSGDAMCLQATKQRQDFLLALEAVVTPSAATLRTTTSRDDGHCAPLHHFRRRGICQHAEAGRSKERFPRCFMKLKHGMLSCDAFSDLFATIDPFDLQSTRTRLCRSVCRSFRRPCTDSGAGHVTFLRRTC